MQPTRRFRGPSRNITRPSGSIFMVKMDWLSKNNISCDFRESQTKLEDEARAKDAARDCLHASERRANSMQNALEEARTLLEQADRSRRITEQDLSDTNEQLSDLTCTNQSIAGAKRKLESEMQTLNVSSKINVS